MNPQQLQKLSRILRLHLNWIKLSIVGKDFVSAEEVKELEEYGKLPLDSSVDLVGLSFVLGRMRALLKNVEYKELSFDQLTSLAKSIGLSDLEKTSKTSVKISIIKSIETFFAGISSSIFRDISDYLDKVVYESSLASFESTTTKKRLHRFAFSDLFKRLYMSQEDTWSRLISTGFQSAKTRGAAQAIVNRVGVYSRANGINSLVSIVPKAGACPDCERHYLDADGNPKVFSLAELLNQKSNMSAGTNHSKKNDIHTSWRTTMSPLHPACSCSLVYVPQGMGWVSGKLSLVNKSLYLESLKKATTPEPTATIKPPGPPSAKPEAPKPPGASLAGMAGRPPSASSSVGTKQMGPKIEYDYWSGPGAPPEGSNYEAYYSERSGKMGYRRPKGSGAGGQLTPQEEQLNLQQKVEDASKWSSKHKDHTEVLNHLSSGKVAVIKTLGAPPGERTASERANSLGANESYVITIEGNGSGVQKPPATSDENWKKIMDSPFGNEPIGYTGAATIPAGTEHHREVGAYRAAMCLGLTDHVPPTTHREHGGKLMSVQHWQDDMHALGHHVVKQLSTEEGPPRHVNAVEHMLKTVPEKERANVEKKMNELAVLGLVVNSTDGHLDNVLVNDDYTNVKSIDHGASFGNGLYSNKNILFKNLHLAGKKVSIPEDMKSRMDKTSFGDLKRSMEGSHVEDWAVGQTFLRMRFVSAMQEKDGHLDFDKLGRGAVFSVDGKRSMPQRWNWRSSESADFSNREQNGLLPHQIFDSWSKGWLDRVSADKSHPDFAAANELKELGVFMGPESFQGFEGGVSAYRKAGKHKEYEAGIEGREDIPSRFLDESGKIKKFSLTQLSETTPKTSRAGSDEATRRTQVTNKPSKRAATTKPTASGTAPTIPAIKSLYIRDKDGSF